MAKYPDQTEIGGAGGIFLTTHWSMIEDIKLKEDKDRALIGLLLERYWKPIYCYLRRKGYNNEQAKDLTQGFFHEVVLNRNLVQRADQCKGRFRSFLLHALNQYIINQNEKRRATIRIPREKLVSLDNMNTSDLPVDVSSYEPDASYNYTWVSALLDQVLTAVKRNCNEDGLQAHWELFHARIVRPILTGTTIPSLSEMCLRLGIEDTRRGSNMIITVKRRFCEMLRKHIRNTVEFNEQVDEELDEIIRFLPKSAQDFK